LSVHRHLRKVLRREPLPVVLRHVWAMHSAWRFMLFGVEQTLFQKLLLDEFDRLGRELGYLPVRGVEQTSNKEARIVSLSPLVERGILRFPRPEQRDDDMRELVEQFLYFPGTHDDGPDATEGAVRMINTGAPNVW
ncbi:MAG: phage terminase large subunit, partial [Rhodocyclales bacterium]|nr:phage terminase large subunit [Rhodocyclales bacterium]